MVVILSRRTLQGATVVIHIASDEPALPIHLAVVQEDALLAGIWIEGLRRRAGIKVQRIEPIA